MTSAWWVPYSQIQRREDGYDVRGKKNFLPPAMLVLGYAILWTTEDEETVNRHVRPQFSEPSEVIDEELVEVDRAEGNPEFYAKSDGESQEEDSKPAIADHNKYSLDDYGSAPDDEDEAVDIRPNVEPLPSAGKPYLTAKQRRDLKKGNRLESKMAEDSEESELDEVSSSVDPTPKQKVAPKVRGKKGKLKKIKARYADQSDEERELARKILGGSSTSSRQEGVPAVSIAETPIAKKPSPAPPLRPPKPAVEEPLEVLRF